MKYVIILVSQLEGLGYIKILIKVAGADFGLINMTKEGLQASSENQVLGEYLVGLDY
jgi:hypothetical protein